MRSRLLIGALLLLASQASQAAPATWATSAPVGPNEIDFRLQLTCPAPGLVCSLIDGYDDTQTSMAAGSGSFDLDDVADTLVFDSDSMQDVGGGPQPAYLTLSGTDMSFASVPFAGVPELVNVLVFALSNPPIPATGLDLLTPGDYPFSELVSYSGLADVTGDLEFILSGIVVPPADITLSGTFRVLGDIDSDDMIEFELRDVTGTFGLQNVTTIAGESVTVDVTADLVMNLAGETATPVPVPALPAWALGTLAGLLTLAGALLSAGFARSRRR